MKIIHFVISCLLLAFSQVLVFAKPLPHLDLEMTGAEYRPLLEQDLRVSSLDAGDLEPLKTVLDVGKRNLDWLKYINDHREVKNRISFSTPEKQEGYPMDHPRIYNPKIIRDSFDSVLQVLPEGIQEVLINNHPFTAEPPLEDKIYAEWGRQVDYCYQLAARWAIFAPSLPEMAQRKSGDIRGYSFLSQEDNVEDKLRNWGSLDSPTQKRFTSYLVEMCNNNFGGGCENKIQKAILEKKVFDLYTQYLPLSRKQYESLFRIPSARPDLKWNHQPEQVVVPFTEPEDDEIKTFLIDNIQDEWKWGNWNLILNFSPGTANKPRVVFLPGVTPNVDGLGGNTITMDANQPLSEYNVRWTIRHEFGHVLGFPDCYVEFFDPIESAMVSYQVDLTNLMCSRRGHLQERHYSELKRSSSRFR